MTRKLRFLIVALTFLVIRPEARTHAQTPGANTAKKPLTSGESSKPKTPNPEATEDKVVQYLRNLYAWGPEFEIKVGQVKPSPIPDLLEMPVTVGMHGQSDTATVYVSKDGKFMVRGELTDMSVDPLADVRSKLKVGTSPSMGPVDAKITLIEFADFECPSCRQLDTILRDFLPKHPEVRFVYKDFPLTQIHPWAMTASIAAQCAAQQDQPSFWKIHDMIFDAQDSITTSNVSSKMLEFAKQLNLNETAFQACLTNPDIQKKIDTTQSEGQELHITGTPTLFINGRRIVGPDQPLLIQYFEFEQSLYI
jgi:protein-disulfide isomerase